MSKQNSTQNKKSPMLLVLVVAAIVICALLGVIVYLLTTANSRNGDDASKEAEKQNVTVITADNVDEVVEQMAEEEDDLRTQAATYRVTMSPEWTFKAGETVAVDAYVENSTANSTMVYYTITLEDNPEEEILHSPYMEVGSKMTDGDIELDQPLGEGTYSAVITYHLVDDEFNELSTVSMYMTIIVEQ